MLAEALFSVRGRRVIVTGASSGFGDRFTRVLASNGAKVLAVARRQLRLTALADELPDVVPYAADLSDDAARAKVVDVALDELGGIDVLVNNAGITSSTPAVEEPIDEFRDAMEINLTAAFDLARRCAPVMQGAGGGSIVNVASTYGLVAATPLGSASYAASKGALVNLTRHLGCEWASDGVRVNALAPGFFPTEMTASIEPDTPPHRYVVRNTPMRRFGLDHELDGILLYLASDASTYCTGQTFAVDGGWTAR